MQKWIRNTYLLIALIFCSSSTIANATNDLTVQQAENIAKEAYIYGFPMVENYKTMYAYAIDKKNPEYKAPFNQISSAANVFTPKDTTIVTPNSDTPYSFVWADLRAEPLVLSVPKIDSNRYYSIQFVDLYTYNFAYVGSRTTGNDEGKFLLVGPNWQGILPKGIKKIIHSDTNLALLNYRTQLFNPNDIDNVRKIQAQYTVQPLSQFLGKPASPAAPKLDFPEYSSAQATSSGFFNDLNFLLQFCPTISGDRAVRDIFTEVGIVPGKPFNSSAFSPEINKAIETGMTEGSQEINAALPTVKSAADLFGTREYMKNNYLMRALGAKMGIYGNSKEEAFYFSFLTDVDGAKLDGTHNRYVIHFANNALPPANAFWSLTMYDGKTQLLVANPINRYLINSSMLPNLHRDSDGGLSIYMQHEMPTKEKISNWLPAPKGPIYLILRLYWPQESVLNGTWNPPPLRKI